MERLRRAWTAPQPASAAFRPVWGDRPNPLAITLLSVSALAHAAFLLETPQDERGDDAKNLAALRGFVEAADA